MGAGTTDESGDNLIDPGTATETSKIVKVKVPGRLWRLLEEVAKLQDVPTKTAFWLMMMSLDENLALGNLCGLPHTWHRAITNMERAGAMIDPDEVQIDLSALHKSTRNKTGYEGVYPNGSHFTARGKNSRGVGLVNLGTHRTIEEAAWARYLHYKKHKIPYGEMEVAIDFQSTRPELISAGIDVGDREIAKRFAIHHAKHVTGVPFPGLTREERYWESHDPLMYAFGNDNNGKPLPEPKEPKEPPTDE